MATTKYIVNNVTGQTINGESILPAYKVYTALLTQNGGDNIQSISSGILTIGVTYRITDDTSNPDFTNVGAPNNNLDTYFVATGTTPNSWGQAELQYNEGAPVVTVLENTIGNIWFTYNETGRYNVNSSSLFITNKTVIITSSFFNSNDAANILFMNEVVENTDSLLPFRTFDGFPADSLLYNTPIEIRVYN